MNTIKKILNRIFIEGLSGMALGLFGTLIVGTIISQIGNQIGGEIGIRMVFAGSMAKSIMGAGIGVGVACKFSQGPLVTAAAAVAGMVGAFPNIAGNISLGIPGEPLGAFLSAYVAVEVARLVVGKTKVDILLVPLTGIAVGTSVALTVGPVISDFVKTLGEFINWGTEQQPVLMGIIVAVVMGMILTLPISSAAIGLSLQLSGIAAGAAVIGCSAQMIGFAVSSFRENKVSGLIAQGVGTSMLQIPNIFKKPIIWIPPIIASAILGPISSALLKMVNTPTGSGMGTSGLVGQFTGFEAMTKAGMSSVNALFQLGIMHILLPAIITLAISEFMRKMKWIKKGDMLLKL